ncbi:MAG: transglutaminase domain-containing protein [Prochloraceae cyanobacterium]|nr:transglutaminase domain-containing protein [Prochloraceae cyanobacterium]
MKESDFKTADWMKAYRPFFFENISDLVDIKENTVLLCDKSRGLLTEVDLLSETTTFKKKYDINEYAAVESICYYNGYIYSVYQNKIYVADYYTDEEILKNEIFDSIPNCSDLTGISVTNNKIYLVTENQSILSYDRETKEVKTIGESPGIGADDLCYFKGNLFIVDSKEQTIYVFDLEKGEFIFDILTPFENPTGIAGVYNDRAGKDVLYVSYARPSFKVYDSGDSEFKLNIKTPVADNFIYPLVFKYDPKKKATLSNGFLVEMYYVRKLHALPEIAEKHKSLKDIEWKISLPIDTDRQQVISVESIGNFEMVIEDLEEENIKVAVFSIPEIDLENDRRVFGWKALVKVFGIKYSFKEYEMREISESEIKKYAKYLKNRKKLDMDSDYVITAAKEAVKNLEENEKNNVIAKAKNIRDYIYEKLTYVMDRYHKGTEDVLKSGEGSCGEYLNVFLSLLRLNNIPARKFGQYKIPAYKMQAGEKSVVLSPDFNHVWLEFYVPDIGWVPLESSADDEASSFREWAQRYFMSLSWYHLECRRGSYFEDVFEKGTDRKFNLSANDISIKDIRFKVISELEID